MVSFLTAKRMQKVYDQCDEKVKLIEDKNEKTALKEACKKKCRRVMWLALFIILGYLAVTKFGKYVLSWIAEEGDSAFSIIVPLGISYYSFSTVGYILDIYWKRYRAEQNFLKYALYVTYFPHILQATSPFDEAAVNG